MKLYTLALLASPMLDSDLDPRLSVAVVKAEITHPHEETRKGKKQ